LTCAVIGATPPAMPLFHRVLAVALCAACGGEEEANVSARIGWRFDYRDWTNTAAQPLMLGCDNAPGATDGPAYEPITAVHVVIKDPALQVKGVDEDYDCAMGDGGLAEVKGLVKQAYVMSLEAKNARGQVIYRYAEAPIDLTTLVEQTFDLRTEVGELYLFARYDNGSSFGSLACPEGVESLRYRMRMIKDGVPQDPATAEGEARACDELRNSEQVFIRNVPVAPEEGVGGAFLPTQYELTLEALDAGDNVTHCAKDQRPLDPGDAKLDNSDLMLVAGECP
jgi:hypothetical protein